MYRIGWVRIERSERSGSERSVNPLNPFLPPVGVGATLC